MEEDLAPQGGDLQWVERRLAECLRQECVRLTTARNLRMGSEREVWECTLEVNGDHSAAILTIFKPGSLESVNTSLPPDPAARKCALAMTELSALGIPTPRVLGYAAGGSEAAVACERIERTDWTPDVRIQAARVLARIHSLRASFLSEPLQELARISDPREYRTTGGHAPLPEAKTLVHGDYFSANILPVTGGLRVIDWETFGWGDPMWDLGFLIGADRGLTDDEVEAVITGYESGAAVDRHRLSWHKRWWSGYWKTRDASYVAERCQGAA